MTQPAESEAQRNEEKPYTAVITVHGMGAPRRYDNVCNLVDTLERYASSDDAKFGEWRDVEAKRWKVDGLQRDHLYYLRAWHLPIKGNWKDARQVRFFEAYWAPRLAGGLPALDVLKWYFFQVPKAYERLKAPWRSFGRIRIGELHQMIEEGVADPQLAGTLMGAYKRFEQRDLLTDYPEGTFEQFVKFLHEPKDANQPSTPAELEYALRLVDLATTWEKRIAQASTTALWSSLALVGLILSVFLFLVTVVAAVSSLSWQAFLDPIAFWQGNVWARGLFQWVAGFLLTVGVGYFLSHYLGDVAYWATYDENDLKAEKRQEILTDCTELLEAVVRDARCGRVIIVAHSLGSRVAYETLLWLNYRRLARNNSREDIDFQGLEKIRHFITYGSPIDKIHYFMESRKRFSHRYERTYNALVGDVSKMPFKLNRHPQLLWVNFHTPGDAISGPVHTPGDLTSPDPMIFNVPVVNLNTINMGVNHTSYMQNKLVVDWLFRVTTNPALDRGSAAPPVPSSQQGAAAHLRHVQKQYKSLFVYPVIVLLVLLSAFVHRPWLTGALWVIATLILGYMLWQTFGRGERHVNPIPMPPPRKRPSNPGSP